MLDKWIGRILQLKLRQCPLGTSSAFNCMDIYSRMLPRMKWTDQGCLKNSLQLNQTLDFFLPELPFLRAFTLGNMSFFLCPFEICMCVCVHAQSCPTLCNPIDYSPPGSSVHGGLQARILGGSGLPRLLPWDLLTQGSNPCVSCISGIGRWLLYHCAAWETFWDTNLFKNFLPLWQPKASFLKDLEAFSLKCDSTPVSQSLWGGRSLTSVAKEKETGRICNCKHPNQTPVSSSVLFLSFYRIRR